MFQWHKSTELEYRREATPFVRKYKVWNSILGLSLSACALVFMTHSGRVCAGWYLPSQRYQGLVEGLDGSHTIERDTYLLSRGGWFVIAACFGFGNVLGFVFVGYKAVN